MNLNIHRIIKNTDSEGYGRRFGIWTQGCSIRCKDCENKDTWEFDIGIKWNVDDLVTIINNETGIDGITILGGEPLDQIIAVSELCTKVKKIGLSVILFTGYSISEEDIRLNCKINELLSNVDLLIDGPFKVDQTIGAPNLSGSRNQSVRYLSDYFMNKSYAMNNKFEIRIEPTGLVRVNGMGNVSKLKKQLEEII